MSTIKAGDWIGEYTSSTGIGSISLSGAIDGYGTFSNIGDGQLYYTIQEGENRECGVGTLAGTTFTRDTIFATYVDGSYNKNGAPLNLTGFGEVYCTVVANFVTLFNEAKNKLDGIEANAKDDQDASEVPYTSASIAPDNVKDAIDYLVDALAKYPDFDKVVDTTTDQTIDGIKSFTKNVLMNDAQNTNGNALVKMFTLSKEIGAAKKASVPSLGTNKAAVMPKGTEAERPVGIPGLLRYNTETNKFEGYTPKGWGAIGGESTVIRNEVKGLFPSGTTTFKIDYDPRFVDVYVNGYKYPSTAYTATDTSYVILHKPLKVESFVEIRAWNYYRIAELPILINDNLLINGDFSVWQRGANFSNVSQAAYHVDRWVTAIYGDTVAVSRQTNIAAVSTPYVHFQPTVDNGNIGLLQRIENWRQFQGATLTFSCLVNTNEESAFYVAHGYGNDNSNAGFKVVPKGKWTRLSWTFDAVDVSTGNQESYSVSIRKQTANKSEFRIAQCKLEFGAVATPFVADDPATNLAKCQRYYCKVSNTYPAAPSSLTRRVAAVDFPATMHRSPTVTPTVSGDANWTLNAWTSGFRLRWGTGVSAVETTITNYTADAEL